MWLNLTTDFKNCHHLGLRYQFVQLCLRMLNLLKVPLKGNTYDPMPLIPQIISMNKNCNYVIQELTDSLWKSCENNYNLHI